MLLEGCQGKKGVEITEKVCPNCGNLVEIFSTEICAECEKCGSVVYSDLVDCVQWCPKAKECVGEHLYARLLEARARQDTQMQAFSDSDEW